MLRMYLSTLKMLRKFFAALILAAISIDLPGHAQLDKQFEAQQEERDKEAAKRAKRRDMCFLIAAHEVRYFQHKNTDPLEVLGFWAGENSVVQVHAEEVGNNCKLKRVGKLGVQENNQLWKIKENKLMLYVKQKDGTVFVKYKIPVSSPLIPGPPSSW